LQLIADRLVSFLPTERLPTARRSAPWTEYGSAMGQATTATAALGRSGFPLDGLALTVLGCREEDINQML